MTPNFYFNNFLIEDRENKLFSFLPFIPKCVERFDEIIKPTVEFSGLEAKITSDEKSSREIVEKVYEGINVSKVLLFDLSKDYRYNDKVNPNVAYEMGIARSIRSDNDILLITDVEEIEKEIFFDVRGMNIIKIQEDFTKDKFYQILKLLCEKQKYYQDKRIEAISRLVDGEGIKLMYAKGRLPEGYRHFGSNSMSPGEKASALRLLDLGIIETKWGCYEKGYEYAYWWTSLGKAVMRYMGINEISLEEFKKSPLYQEHLKAEEDYKKFRREIGG